MTPSFPVRSLRSNCPAPTHSGASGSALELLGSEASQGPCEKGDLGVGAHIQVLIPLQPG